MTRLLLLLITLPVLFGVVFVQQDGGGSSDFCDTAGANLFCEDFEEGQSTCTSLVTNPADTLEDTPDCASTASPGPLGGSYSFLVDGDTAGVAVSATWENDFSAACDTNNCRVTFKFAAADSTIHSSSPQYMLGLLTTGARVMEFRYGESANLAECRTDDVSAGCGVNDITLVDGTMYYICMDYDFSVSPDTATIYIDDDAVTCSTAADVGGSSGEGISWCSCDQTTTNLTTANQIHIRTSVDRGDLLFDDIVVTEDN